MTTDILQINTTETIVMPDQPETLVSEVQVVQLVEVPQQGFPGPRGLPGEPGSAYFVMTAGEALGGHRIVVGFQGKAFYADHTNPDHCNAVIGMTLNAAAAGDEVRVQVSGQVSEPTWNWTAWKPIFLGTQGQLTQTYVGEGFTQIVATPMDAKTVTVNIKQPIKH
ncbi:hypothetical protein FDI24_gp187 [Acidovorax phage ACP17]|uniref:Uncharacterized protein n=1 Tax=Acidovorax phage ACP17 TaxID=2010329 RepID=A0A218M359_9CAUD|nr:hypothetical protein FDI24_gp187 [Acidovorax phage ACP17]ASD50469.1 hypothetical protein [Acidovorax phage ACP17]